MSELVIQSLCASVDGKEILKGIDLTVTSGSVHAIMGPNGAGKSTLAAVLMGREEYEVTSGTVTLDGLDLLAMAPYERCRAGMFLVMQYPTAVPGVSVSDVVDAAYDAHGIDSTDLGARLEREAELLGVETEMLTRSINVDFSGGEKKRNETLQLSMLKPKFAILDELDSGLDVDAMKLASARVEKATEEDGLGVIAITHYNRLLDDLHADHVHVLVDGRIVDTGPATLADEIEANGYDRWLSQVASEVSVGIGSLSRRS